MTLLSMNQLTTYRWSFEEDLHHYSRAGYQGVGVWLRKLYDFGVERAAELVEESGLKVSNVVWAGGFTGSDGAPSADNLAAATRALEAAQAIRAGCLVVYTGGRNSHTTRHADRLLRSALDKLLPVAEATGVPLALEPMHPACAAEWTFLTSLEATAEIVQSYDTRSLQMVYDTYHFPPQSLADGLLEWIAPMLSVVHLGDYAQPHDLDQDRCSLGAGQAELIGLVPTLREAGYNGFFDVELLGAEIEAADYQRLISDSRRAVLSLQSLALSEAS